MELKPLFVFPRWSNSVVLTVLVIILIFPVYAGALVAYALDPVTLNVGYAPTQPVPYSHALHAGQLGIDCRYCHNTVERADFAALPPTETCMNCHKGIWPQSDKLALVRESYLTGQPIKWKKVNDLPDYVYFNHSAHVNAAISCVECHGNVNHMEVVAQVKPMNMAWCLQCHRDPTKYIRPRDEVTNLDWEPVASVDHLSAARVFTLLSDRELMARALHAEPNFKNPGDTLTPDSKLFLAFTYLAKLHETESNDTIKRQIGTILREQYHINPNTDCVTCHR